MNDVPLTATQWLDRLLAGDITSRELTQHYLDVISRRDPRVGAFVQVDADRALEQAEAIDQRRQRGAAVGRLAGLPVALKDVLCTRGTPTTCASRMLSDFRPPYDATVVARLRQADAVLLGKTNMDEFAMGGSTENSAFHVTRNPWDLERTPGGSSGGSAACVAAGMAPLALGTDTGGSIRQPAAFCGVVGMKPTYGRVSRYGLIAFASSLDQVGPLARSAEDAALLLEVIAGPDAADSTSAGQPVPRYLEQARRPLDGLRLGLVREHFGTGLDPEIESAVRAAIRDFQSLGATLREISLPHNKYAIATYYIIAPCEASSNLARYDGAHYGFRCDPSRLPGESQEAVEEPDEDSPLIQMYRQTRAQGFGAEVKRRIMLGTYALSAGYYDAYYLKALRVRRLIHDDYTAAFREVDLVVGPTTPRAAFRLGEMLNEPLAMYLQDLYTVSANLAGIAGLSLPCGRTADGLPIGLQLQAPAFQEERLLRAAYHYQQQTDWHLQRPPH